MGCLFRDTGEGSFHGLALDLHIDGGRITDGFYGARHELRVYER